MKSVDRVATWFDNYAREAPNKANATCLRGVARL